MERDECLNNLIITRAIVIPSYSEDLALLPLLTTLAGSLSNLFRCQEIPIVFTDRELGSSTVTWQEIVNSIIGINKLVSIEFGSRFMSK